MSTDDDVNIFISSEWIGKGLTYPQTPPDCLSEAKKQDFTLPMELQMRFLPNYMTTISDLALKKFPSESNTIVSVKPEL